MRFSNPGVDGASRPSRTARLMAVQRGLESARSPRSRLFCDPFAPGFVSPVWRMALRGARRELVRRAIEAVYDFVGGPGPRASAVARTKLIDDLIEGECADFDQLVILGAGYDTRAHRIERLADRTVFEVDRPATQADKRAILERVAGSARRAPIYVPVDFECDDLATALRNAGHHTKRRTLYLWEGVTQYLSAETVDATIDAIRQTARPGDRLTFTYVDSAALTPESERFPEASRWLRETARRGEPWIYGLSPSALREFLDERGFTLTSDVSTREAGECYFRPLRRSDQASGLYRVATATTA